MFGWGFLSSVFGVSVRVYGVEDHVRWWLLSLIRVYVVSSVVYIVVLHEVACGVLFGLSRRGSYDSLW